MELVSLDCCQERRDWTKIPPPRSGPELLLPLSHQCCATCFPLRRGPVWTGRLWLSIPLHVYQDHQRFLPGLELCLVSPCLCQQAWHIPVRHMLAAGPHGAVGSFSEGAFLGKCVWEMRRYPSLSLPQECTASIIHCRAGRLGSQHSQHSQPCCWSALGCCANSSSQPGSWWALPWQSHGRAQEWWLGAGGSVRPAGAGVSACCWEPGSSQASFLGHPRPTAGSALAWREGRPPAW